jgi:hypothetical protein
MPMTPKERAMPRTITTERLLARVHRAESAVDRHPPGTVMWAQARDLADHARNTYERRVDEINKGRRFVEP